MGREMPLAPVRQDPYTDRLNLEMKTLFQHLKIASFLVMLCAGVQASAFDGDVITKTTMGDQSMVTTYTAKGDIMKFEMPRGDTTIILDAGREQRITIDHRNKEYYVEAVDPERVPQPKGVVEDMGERAEILGYPVRKLKFKLDNGGYYLIWATTGIDNEALTSMPGMTAAMKAEIEEIFGAKNVFPMKLVVYQPNGVKSMTMEVTAVNERPVSDFEITLPRSYEEKYLVPREQMKP